MKGYLHLYDGNVYEGNWVTSPPSQDIKGEIVFYTGMTGYEKVLTDPLYENKIIVFTYPLIGNCGIDERSLEGKKPSAAGVVVYEANMEPSHYQANNTFGQYLEKWDIPLLSHIDTRTVVKKIRNQGSIHAYLTDSKEKNKFNRSAIAYA